MLRLFIGGASAGKTGALHAALRRRVEHGGSAALLLPSTPDVMRDLGELAHHASVGLSVSTFDAHLDRLWDGLGTGLRIVSGTHRLVLLEDIVSSSELKHLAGSSRAPGFVGTMADFIQRATWHSIVPDRAPGMDGPGHEIASLVRAYQARLSAEGLIERAQAHMHLAAHPDEWTVPDTVAINRFTGFTFAQEAFIAALATRCELVVALTFDEAVPATHGARALVERLSRVGEVVEVEADKPHSLSPELIRIERAYGSPASDGDDGVGADGAVMLSEAWGDNAEAARVAREVQNALEAGIAAGQIVVAFRDPARHLGALRAAFAEAGVGADWDLRVRFDATRLGRAVLLLLGYYGGTQSPRALMDVLRSPYVGASQDALDELDVWLRSIRTASAGAFERRIKALDRVASTFIAEGRAAYRALGGQDGERRWWGLLGRMMGNARTGAPILDVDGLLDAAAARSVIRCVIDLDAATSKTPAAVLMAALRATTVSIGSAGRPDAVQVMSAERLRGRRYRCVILGGLVSGEFPRGAHEDAFASPLIRGDLARAGIEAPGRGTLADERLMFYQAVTRASERLVLSWQSHDADGRPLRPSLFLEELLDLYRAGDGLTWRRGEPPRRVMGLDETSGAETAPRSVRRELREAAALRAGGADGVGAERLAHAWYRVRTHTGRLGATVLADLAARDIFSVSDIETYLACPYQWYIQRAVKPAGIDAEIDSAAAGRLAHDILRQVYDRLLEEPGVERIDEGTVDRALEIHAAVSAEAVSRVRMSSAREEAMIRAVVRRTAGVLEADVRFAPGFVPRHREWSFGLEPDDPPESFGSFALVGRIDRVDVDERRLIVSDYKSGTVSSRHARAAFAAQGLVQAPLYAVVASRRLGLEPAGAVYRSIRGGRPRGFIREDAFESSPDLVRTDRVTPEEIEALIADAIDRAEVAVAGIRAGEIPAEPRDGRCPDYCPARAFCRRGGGTHAHAR